MTDKFSIQKIGGDFQRTGRISLWIHIVLGTVAIFSILALALFGGGTTPAPTTPLPTAPASGPAPGSGFGLFFAVLGVLGLAVAGYWAFRYMVFGKQLQAEDEAARPSRAAALQLLRQGLIANLVGMLFSIIGAQAIAGSLFMKAVQQQGVFINLVKAIDMMGVQASTNAITAHFFGILASLWLLSRVSR
jgi:hypothetical protein